MLLIRPVPFVGPPTGRYTCLQCRVHRAVRRFAALTAVQSGHSRWSKIKHDKAKNDAAMNKHRTLLSKDISFASQMLGPDPNANPRLALAIAKAKQAGFPKASIETAIARGQGISVTGAKLESVIIEAMIPPSVAAVIDVQTDNKLRTLADVRLVIKEHGGQPASTAYLFERKGQVVFSGRKGVTLDDLLEPALEAGALDIEETEEDGFNVYTEPAAIKPVTDALINTLGLEVKASDIVYTPRDKVQLQSKEQEENLASMVGKLKDIQGVQDIYINAK